MDFLKSAFDFLNDPQKVANFQEYFGIELLDSPQFTLPNRQVISQDQGGINGSAHHNLNGLSRSDSVISDGKNGDISVNSNNYNLRSRRIGNFSENGNGPVKSISGHSRQYSNATSMSASSLSESDMNDYVSDDTCEASCDEEGRTLRYHVNNKYWYWLFSFGASLGNEMFYCTFFPFWFWNMDGYVARRMVLVWSIVMYFGQAAKDVIRWPRPKTPPVVRLESRYELEYGMPSTHACIAFSVPFILLSVSIPRYNFPHIPSTIFGLCWCCLVCSSRLYLGMHSIADIIAGLVFSILICAGLAPILNTIDTFQLETDYGCWVVVGVGLLGCIVYPSIDKWSTARGDTTLVVAVACGVSLGCRLNYLQGYLRRYHLEPPYQALYPNLEWFGPVFLRFALGVIVLLATRFLMKMITYRLLCWLLGYDKRERSKNSRQIYVELPYKFLTYGAVAFNVVYTAPLLFRLAGIERVTSFTEL